MTSIKAADPDAETTTGEEAPLSASSEAPEGALGRLEALRAAGQPRKAVELVEEALREGAGVDDTARLLAAVVEVYEKELRDAGAAERAIALVEKAHPADPRFARMRAALLARTGKAEDALRVLGKIAEDSDDDAERAELWEQMGDLCRDVLSRSKDALVHYQSAFRAHRQRRTAVRKAAELYLEAGREEQAKQLTDLESELLAHMAPRPQELVDDVAGMYVRISEILLLRPPAHEIARDALERALKLAPADARARALLDQLEAFPTRWKEHVRRLRDAALDARDKREAARNYLAIAQIHRAFDPDSRDQMEQNIEKCLLLAPGYRPALKFLEGVYREEGRMEAFLDRLRTLAGNIRTADVAVDIWLFIAVLIAEQGAGPDALAVAYEKVRSLDPRHLGAISALTEIHLGAGRYEQAAQVMEDFLAETSDVEAKRSTLRTLARIYEVEVKDLAKARERLEALRALGAGGDALLHLAELCEKLGDQARLADVLEQLLESPAAARYSTEGPQSILEKLLELYQGDVAVPDKAFAAARKLFVLVPRAALEQELTRLADALARPGDLGETLVKAAERSEDPAEARRLSLEGARAFVRAGAARRAREVLDGLLAKNPKDRDALEILDHFLAEEADPEELVRVLEARLASQDEPDDRVRTLLALADGYGRLRRPAELIERLRAVLDIAPKHERALERLDQALRAEERWGDLADVVERRARLAKGEGDTEKATQLQLRLAQLYDERLGRGEDAAQLYLEIHEASPGSHDVLRALERLQARGAAVVPIAEALQPYYARVEAWRRHVEMIAIRRDAEEDGARRGALSRAMASVLEEKLKSPREAFDAWGAALLDEPTSADAVREATRLADVAGAHARLAEVIEEAADRLPDGPPKNALLARRAALLQGVLGDQAAAIEAHRGLLDKSPGHLPSLDALVELYERREAWGELREVLSRRLDLSSPEEAPGFAARLGILQLERFGNVPLAREALERALYGEPALAGALRTDALRSYARALERAREASGQKQDAEALAKALADLAQCLAGSDRADVRATLGEVYRVHLGRPEEALAAYEAALANAPEHAAAEAGVRALLDDEGAPRGVRRSAARLLLPRYDAAENHAARAHVLSAQLALEETPQAKRQLVRELAHLFAAELEDPDEALGILLRHVEEDPADAATRQEAENLAFAAGKPGELLATWMRLRDVGDEALGRLYAERVADLAERMQDPERSAEALQHLAARAPKDAATWERLRAAKERLGDREGVARCLMQLAELGDGLVRTERLKILSDYCFEVLEDPERGLEALRDCRRMSPGDDTVLARLQQRLVEHQRGGELAEVLGARAELADNPAVKAALLLEQGALLLDGLSQPEDAVTALTRSLEVERDGNSTARVSELLQRVARRDDHAGLIALDAIVDHHRAQEAWQPLVESLEIAAFKRPAGEERARLLDEVSRLHEERLRVPQLAFREACRAFRDAPTPERDQRVHQLAHATGSFAELMAVLEDVAEAIVDSDPARAADLYREVCELARTRLDDREAQVRAAEAVLKLDRSDADALAVLEDIHRAEKDRDRLIAVLERRAAATDELAQRHRTLLELGKLLAERGDDERAEAVFRQVHHEDATNDAALAALDHLYHRTGNSAAHVEVLDQRVALAPTLDDRARLRVRLAYLRLARRGDPAGATDQLSLAVEEAGKLAEVRQAVEGLVEHARTHGVPPLPAAALLLERALRAQEDWSALPNAVEMRLLGEADHSARATLMLEVATIYEQKLEQPDFAFMWVCNALKELPEDASLRNEAERLGRQTENEDALKDLYEDLLDEVQDPQLRALFNRRIAEIAEQVEGDSDEALRHLHAAVQSGATDLGTLESLVRLSRQKGSLSEHADVLLKMAESAVLEGRTGVAKEAYAELCDVEEELGNLDGAIRAARELTVLDPDDNEARATLERLLNRAERWSELASFLDEVAERAPTPEQKAQVLSRLVRVRLERLVDAAAAVVTLEKLSEVLPSSDEIVPLGGRVLQVLAADGRPEAIRWRGRTAVLLEPRYEASESWEPLVHALRLRLEMTPDPDERQRLWLRIVDLYERVLDQPEQAFMALGRALGAAPQDNFLRDKAERLSVRLGDLETLIGLYEDIGEKLPKEDPLRAVYVVRCAELWEGGVGDPQRAALYYEAGLGLLAQSGAALTERRNILERLERLLRAIGDPGRLAQTLKRRAELIEDGPEQAAKSRQLLFEAATIEMHGLGDYGAAISTLQRLLEASPQDLPALRALADACQRQQRWADLAETLERELAVLGNSEPERALKVRFSLGVVLDTHLELPDDALAQFQAILEMAPDHAETRAYLEQRLEQRDTLRFDNAEFLQRSYERTGDWAKAVEVLRQQVADVERRGDLKEAAQLLARVAEIQEHKLGQATLAFGTLCTALKHDAANASIRARLFALANDNELIEDLCEVYEEEAGAAEEAGRSALAADLREQAAALYVSPLGEIARAIEAYEEVLEKHPGRQAPLETLTRLYAQEGRWEDLERILRRRLMFLDEAPARAPLLVELAQTLADHLDRPDEAIPLLEEVRHSQPGHVGARRLLIELYDGAEHMEALRALLEDELQACREAEDRPGLARARGRLAVLLSEQLGDVDAAIPLWEEMRADDPGDNAAFVALERLYELSERWADLRKIYEETLERTRDPDVVSALTLKLGAVLSQHLGGKEEAVERHVKALELDPRSEASLRALRALYRDLGRWEDLVALIRRMMRLQTDPVPLKDLRFELAEVLGEHLGKRAESVEAGRRILDIEPHSSAELERLAGVFRRNEAFEELAGVLERLAGALEPGDKVACLIELAEVYEQRLSRPDAAAPAYEQVLGVEPMHARAYARLCEIWAEAGEWQRLVALKEERTRRAESVDDRIALLREIGRIYEEQLGQKEMAFLAACRAFRERFEDREVASWMDRLAVETDSVEELLAIYDDALGHLNDEGLILSTHLRMAELAWEELKEADDAELHLRRVLEYRADDAVALDRLIALYADLERWSDAVAVLERKADLAPDPAARIEILRQIARMLDDKAEDTDAAVAAYKRILDLDAADALALRALSDLLERAERWQQLISVLTRQEEMAESIADKLQLRYRVANIWEQELDNPEQAIAVHRSMLELDEGYALSLKALERLNTSLGRGSDLISVFEQMLKTAASDEDRVRLLGKIAATWEESFENLPSAIEANDRILEIDPRNLGAIKSLERLLRQAQDWERLVDVLEKHVSFSQEPGEIISIYLQMGEVYHRELSQADKAEAAYNAALDFDPGSREALHALGQLYERSGNWFNALEKLTQEAQLAGATPEGVELYYRIGKINEEMLLDVGSAKDAYSSALGLDPSYLPAIRALKDVALSRKEHDEYLKWLRAEASYTDDEPERTELHTAAGLFLQDTLGDIDQAAEELEKALAVTFDHLPAARPLADICFRNESWERTEQLLDIIVEQIDGTAEPAELVRYHYRLGYVCEKLGKDTKALKHYQRAYEIDATYLPGLEGLGAALNRAARWDDAAKIYQAILIHHRDNLTDAEVVDYYELLAELNHKLGENDRAVKNLAKALEIDSGHAASLRLLAKVHEAEGRFEDAYEAMMRLVPLLPGSERVDLLVELGRLSAAELDDPYRAIDAFEDANRQRPQDKEILEALLQLYRQTRQGARAVEVLEELVRIEPDEKARVRLNQMLGEVYRDELKNESRAVQYWGAALDLDPTYIKAFQSAEELLATNQNWQGLEEVYLAMLKRISGDQTAIKREIWKNLAGLYRFRLKNPEAAAQAFMVLHKLEPDNVETLDALADLQSRIPAYMDDAIASYQKLLALVSDKPNKPLHALVRLYHHRRQADRAFIASAALKVLGDVGADEAQLYQHYLRQQVPEPRAAMTPKLWDALLVHPDAQGALADVSALLWRAAANVLAQSPKDLGLDKKRVWHHQELDAPVPTFFVTQLKKVRNALALGAFDLYIRRQSADPLMVLPVERLALGVGEANEVFREMPDRQLRFLCARQVAYLRPAFMLPRALGPQRFQACIEAAVRLVEPRYPAKADPREVQEFERLLQRAGPQLAAALRAPVTQLLASKQAVQVKPFLEGMEHTAIRAAYVVTGHLDLAAQLLRQPDPGPMPLPYGAKVKDLLQFAVSDAHFELRQRLGMAITG